MYFATTVILLVGLTSAYAAPALAPAQKEFQADVEKALEPVKSDMRALVKNAQAAAEDLTQGIKESGSSILQAGRSLLTPVEKIDRANIGNELIQRAKTFQNQLQATAKGLMERAIKDAEPLLLNERAAFFNVKDSVNMLEKKYLTSDGQDLAKALMKAVGI